VAGHQNGIYIALSEVLKNNSLLYHSPSLIIKLEENIVKDSMFLSMLLKPLEATNMIFIYILVKCGGKGDVGFDPGDPLVNTTFNLSRRFIMISK
jgi:hypothetical protein